MNANKFTTIGTAGSSGGASRSTTKLLAALVLVAISFGTVSLLATSDAEAMKIPWSRKATPHDAKGYSPKAMLDRWLNNRFRPKVEEPSSQIKSNSGVETPFKKADNLNDKKHNELNVRDDKNNLIQVDDPILGNKNVSDGQKLSLRNIEVNGLKGAAYLGKTFLLTSGVIAGATTGIICAAGKLNTQQCSNGNIIDLGQYIKFDTVTGKNLTVSGGEFTGKVTALSDLADDANVSISAHWGTDKQSAEIKTFKASELRNGKEITIPVVGQMDPATLYNVAFSATVTQGENGGSAMSQPGAFMTLANPVPTDPENTQPKRNGVTFSTDVTATLDAKSNSGKYRFWTGRQGEALTPSEWKDFDKNTTSLAIKLSGLEAEGSYIAKVEVQPKGGTSLEGKEHSFTTAVVPSPGVQVNGADVDQTAATITGTVDNTVDAPITQAYFEFWADGDGFRSTADVTSQLGGGSSPVVAQVSGLKPSTTYNVRLVTTLANGATVDHNGEPFRTNAKPSTPVGPPVHGGSGDTVINTVLQIASGQSISADGAVIKTRSLRLTPDGRAKVKVACVKGDACKGVVILTTAKKGVSSKGKKGVSSKGKKGKKAAKRKGTTPRKAVLVIGTQAFDAIPRGKEVWVNVRLSRRAQTNLKKDGKINAQGYVSAFNTLASTAKANANITILPAKAKRSSKGKRGKKAGVVNAQQSMATLESLLWAVPR